MSLLQKYVSADVSRTNYRGTLIEGIHGHSSIQYTLSDTPSCAEETLLSTQTSSEEPKTFIVGVSCLGLGQL